MKRSVALVALLLACRPSTEPGAEGGAAISVEPSGGEPSSDDAGETVDPEPAPEPSEPPSETPSGPPSGATACELVCANVHTCVLEDNPDRVAATAIELGCLDACVRARESFAACERPEPGTTSCVDFLACARRAWPTGDRPATIVEPPPDGCRLACHAFARCKDSPVETAEECAKLCREALDENQQRMAADCAKPDDCRAVESCINSLPGAV